MSERFRAGIAGATGYTGIELVQWLQRHPQLTIGWITSETSAGKTLADVHAVPWDYPLITLAEASARVQEVDVVFLCLPHGESVAAARSFAAAGVRVVDLSADFRLPDPQCLSALVWQGAHGARAYWLSLSMACVR